MSFIAREPFSNSGSNPLKLREPAVSIRIVNTGTSDMTFELSPYFIYSLEPGEVFDEQVDPFDTVKFTASGTYKGFVRNEVA